MVLKKTHFDPCFFFNSVFFQKKTCFFKKKQNTFFFKKTLRAVHEPFFRGSEMNNRDKRYEGQVLGQNPITRTPPQNTPPSGHSRIKGAIHEPFFHGSEMNTRDRQYEGQVLGRVPKGQKGITTCRVSWLRTSQRAPIHNKAV